MIAKTLPSSAGSARGAVRYSQGHGKEREHEAQHLFGDPEHVVALSEAMNCEHTYLSSVLSFTEEESKRIDIDTIRDLAEDLAAHHAHPLGEENVAGCAYLHHENGRYDVHIIQVRQDLESGKRIDLYVAQAGDTGRIADWQDIKVYELGLDDPREVERKRLTKGLRFDEAARNGINRKEISDALTAGVEHAALNGELNSRAEVKEFLTSLGYTITRETKKGLSIEVPGGKQPLRLAGGIFNEQWAGIEAIGAAAEADRGRSEQDRREHYEQCVERLAKNNERRTARLSKKVGIDFEARRAGIQQASEAAATNDIRSIATSLRDARRDRMVGDEQGRSVEHASPVCDNVSSGDDLGRNPATSSGASASRQEHLHKDKGVSHEPENNGVDTRVQQGATGHKGIARHLAASCKRLIESAGRFGRAMGQRYTNSAGVEHRLSHGTDLIRRQAGRIRERIREASRLSRIAAKLSEIMGRSRALESAINSRAQRLEQKANASALGNIGGDRAKRGQNVSRGQGQGGAMNSGGAGKSGGGAKPGGGKQDNGAAAAAAARRQTEGLYAATAARAGKITAQNEAAFARAHGNAKASDERALAKAELKKALQMELDR